jgi:hypothetical protein
MLKAVFFHGIYMAEINYVTASWHSHSGHCMLPHICPKEVPQLPTSPLPQQDLIWLMLYFVYSQVTYSATQI